MYTVYGNKLSGNSYKVKLVCSLLDIDYYWIEVDILNKENKKPEFLTINPLGQLPVLVIEYDNPSSSYDRNHTIISESNAIIRYLADNSALIPRSSVDYAKMWQWLLYEQNEVRSNLASVRFIKKFQDMIPNRLDEYHKKFNKSKEVLSYLNQQFENNTYILGNAVSLADISLYAYTHKAEDGGLDLTPYSNLLNWFERIETLPNFVKL